MSTQYLSNISRATSIGPNRHRRQATRLLWPAWPPDPLHGRAPIPP